MNFRHLSRAALIAVLCSAICSGAAFADDTSASASPVDSKPDSESAPLPGMPGYSLNDKLAAIAKADVADELLRASDVSVDGKQADVVVSVKGGATCHVHLELAELPVPTGYAPSFVWIATAKRCSLK